MKTKTEIYNEKQKVRSMEANELQKKRDARDRIRRAKEALAKEANTKKPEDVTPEFEETQAVAMISSPWQPPRIDVAGLEYVEGIKTPEVKSFWPWVLEEVTQRKSDNKITKHTATPMNTAQVSKIRISYAKPIDHFNFRHGKPIAIEFNDATTTLKLWRQGKDQITNIKDLHLEGEPKNEVTNEKPL